MSESNKLKEVWKWKENVYEKTKNMTRDERVRFFNEVLSDFTKRTDVEFTIEKRESGKEILSMAR